MSVPALGDRNVYFALKKLIRENVNKISFRPVKQIVFTFDPFHQQVKSTRQFLYYLSNHKISRTNPLCRLKTTIVNDRSDPSVAFTLNNGESVVIKSANFSLVELFELYQQYIAIHNVSSAIEATEPLKPIKPSKGRK